jgi:hypothetical protein
MTMPLTPWVMAASMSAVCLGEDTCPSDSIASYPCFAISALKAFIMCTKKGKLKPGTEARILSAAKATDDISGRVREPRTTDLLDSFIAFLPCFLFVAGHDLMQARRRLPLLSGEHSAFTLRTPQGRCEVPLRTFLTPPRIQAAGPAAPPRQALNHPPAPQAGSRRRETAAAHADRRGGGASATERAMHSRRRRR